MKKSRTQKEINEEIKALENQIEDTRNIRKHRPEIVELEKKIQEIRNAYWEENQGLINCWQDDIRALKQELQRKKSEKEIYLSEKVQKWFSNYLGGIDWGYKTPRIVWISPDERFVIITNPGGTAGQGTAMGTGGYYYASSSHWLTEVVEGQAYMGNRTGVSGQSQKWLEHEGRLTKEVKEKMIKKAEEIAGYSYEK